MAEADVDHLPEVLARHHRAPIVQLLVFIEHVERLLHLQERIFDAVLLVVRLGLLPAALLLKLRVDAINVVTRIVALRLVSVIINSVNDFLRLFLELV